MTTEKPVGEDCETNTFTPDRDNSSPPDLRILHYNDVYHLDPSSADPVGGAARFQTVVDEYRSSERFQGTPELITLFSGDAFNPSLESSVTKGSHMVPILNNLGTECACIGNHDLDFGVTQFQYLTAKCTFPWLCANIFDPAAGEGKPIGNTSKTHMITSSNGIKIGLIGLGEREWLETVNALPPDVVYKSAVQTARELIPQVRKEGADMIIILSHAREPNDNKLAGADGVGGEADLILGGHDHYYSHSLIRGTHVLRSGSDFRQLSYLEAWRRPGTTNKWDFSIRRRDVVSSITPDPATVTLIDQLTAKLKQSLEKSVGWTAAPLDARFTTVRKEESNIANFVCDIMRYHYNADCVIMAAGTVRGDQIYPPGPIRVKDITDCFPFEDPVVVVKVTGKAIFDALENGVSLYPALEGRFPQVSNIKYTFNPALPSGSRIREVELGGEPLDYEKQYILCTRGYMVRGKDGYKSLLSKAEGGVAEEIVDEESGILISMMLRQYFMSLKVLDQWKHWSPAMGRHWGRVESEINSHHPHLTPCQSPKSPSAAGAHGAGGRPDSWDNWAAAKLRRRRSSITPFDEHVVEGAIPSSNAREVQNIDRQLQIMRRVARKWCRLAGVRGRQCDTLTEDEYDVEWTKAIAPRVEGRIRIVEQ